MALRQKKIRILTPMDAEFLKDEICELCGENFRIDQAVLLRVRLRKKRWVHLNCAEVNRSETPFSNRI